MKDYFSQERTYDHYNYKIAELVGFDETILDVGCATGKLLENLEKNKRCKTFGIELDEGMAAEARKRCSHVMCGDIETCQDLPFKKHYFDSIIFGDVLEHLKRPDRVLRNIRPYLKQGGCLVISLPNIAYFPVRLNLMFGRFEYSEYGVLDKSHLRFFTRKTAQRFIEASGYKITHVEGYSQVDVPYVQLLDNIFTGLFAINFVIKAVNDS